MKRYAAVLLIVFFAAAASCERQEGPPVPGRVFYGEDICERCKMIINEREFSAQYVLKNGGVKKFDDIGCMLHFLKNNNIDRGALGGIYVRDYGSGRWIDAESAFYVVSDNIKTPMAHGIVAHGERVAAEALAKDKSGIVLKGLDGASNKISSNR
ncbi:MAG: nitrous oxide reductase accessory protein NosL [Candidatus Dadabacteria bacterium]|nr:nitrous oxide reductase accessory protein NosL [Candidatus Dadabacteria bacterium]